MKRPLPADLIEKQVSVYRNLHQNCLSVIHKRLVVGHADTIVLKDVQFNVRERGRQRCLQEKKKNAHAFVKGTLVQNASFEREGDSIQVTYNPYKSGCFYDRATNEPITRCRMAVVTTAGIIAYR